MRFDNLIANPPGPAPFSHRLTRRRRLTDSAATIGEFRPPGRFRRLRLQTSDAQQRRGWPLRLSSTLAILLPRANSGEHGSRHGGLSVEDPTPASY
ncbi:unnamed protein product [Cuscuta campestris]|uniref:Uncharacterized protein n=2 Tax=Cuscuta sect. Cleistogrammica TaxID=1824901 RepID=A0A484NE86_9ASTE|nr:hypothetical protein DM860_017336 [Cuscuta australis]VFQ99721.1 unnamed protein product [Cuscuta campestris]